MGTARHRHLGANHIDQIALAKSGQTGLLGDLRQSCRPFSDQLVGQGNGIALTGHAAVEVDLLEPGRDIAGDEIFGMCHGLPGRFPLPAVGAQMVAPQNEALRRKVTLCRQLVEAIAKVSGGHAGIAAKLIHLIGGGLDQQQLIPFGSQPQRGLQHQRVSGADGVDPGLFSLFMSFDQCQHGFHFDVPWLLRMEMFFRFLFFTVVGRKRKRNKRVARS